MESSLKKVVERIPVCKTKAGPRDKDDWLVRLAEEYTALIKVCTTETVGKIEETRLSVSLTPLVQSIMNSLFLHSTSRIIKPRTTTGSTWNRMSSAINGMGAAGAYMICKPTSSISSLRYEID